MSAKINPDLVRPTRVRIYLPQKRKVYVPAYLYKGKAFMIGKKAYRTAELAELRAQAVITRWRGIYAAGKVES